MQNKVKKLIKIDACVLGLTILVISFVLTGQMSRPVKAATDTKDVSLSTNAQEYLTFTITAGSSIAFGDLSPGSPVVGSNGTTTSVTTNAANGYTLAVSDSVSGSDSALLHSDTTTRILDYSGTIATPTSWSGTGFGFCLYSGTNKDAKWGTGTSYNDSNNKYAGVPQTATTIMTKTGYTEGADTAGIGWKVDVPNTQKTGSYSGSVTLTVTAVL